MGELRQSGEGCDFPINSKILVDDIKFEIHDYQPGPFLLCGPDTIHPYPTTHHVLDNKEIELRAKLNPYALTFIPSIRWPDLSCPQVHFRGYINQRKDDG